MPIIVNVLCTIAGVAIWQVAKWAYRQWRQGKPKPTWNKVAKTGENNARDES